jgi:hypothetical protein
LACAPCRCGARPGSVHTTFSQHPFTPPVRSTRSHHSFTPPVHAACHAGALCAAHHARTVRRTRPAPPRAPHGHRAACAYSHHARGPAAYETSACRLPHMWVLCSRVQLDAQPSRRACRDAAGSWDRADGAARAPIETCWLARRHFSACPRRCLAPPRSPLVSHTVHWVTRLSARLW